MFRPRQLLRPLAPALLTLLIGLGFLAFSAGPVGPTGPQNGDANGNGSLDVGDIVYLLEYLFQSGPEPIAIATDPELPPIGAIIDWWAPNPATPIPVGYVPCLGGAVSDPLSPLFGEPIPNLVFRYPRGAETPADVGTVGGASSHTHSAASAHEHGLVSGMSQSDLGHEHLWARFSSSSLTWRDGQQNVIVSFTNGTPSAGSGHYPLSPPPGSPSLFLDTSTHSHAHGTVTLSVDAPTVFAHSNVPPTFRLTKLMRIY